MNNSNYPIRPSEDEYNSNEEYNDAKLNNRKQSIGERPIRFSWMWVLGLVIFVYFLTYLPSIFSHYFSDINNESIVLGIGVVLLIIAIAVVAAISGSNAKTEKTDMTHVSNEYHIRKMYTQKKNANTSVDADTGRCSACGAKVSRTNTNCPKCGRIIR